MPTEDESTLPQTPPGIETSTSYVHCPPDLEREIHAPREPREQDLIAEVIISSDAEQHVSNALDARTDALEQDQYGKRGQTDVVTADSPSAHGSPEVSSDRDTRLGRSAVIAPSSSSWSNGEDLPMYLSYPPIGRRKVCSHLLLRVIPVSVLTRYRSRSCPIRLHLTCIRAASSEELSNQTDNGMMCKSRSKMSIWRSLFCADICEYKVRFTCFAFSRCEN